MRAALFAVRFNAVVGVGLEINSATVHIFVEPGAMLSVLTLCEIVPDV